ncbi:hypothetical protein HK405_015290, partial [Cladochytrium tenue]
MTSRRDGASAASAAPSHKLRRSHVPASLSTIVLALLALIVLSPIAISFPLRGGNGADPPLPLAADFANPIARVRVAINPSLARNAAGLRRRNQATGSVSDGPWILRRGLDPDANGDGTEEGTEMTTFSSSSGPPTFASPMEAMVGSSAFSSSSSSRPDGSQPRRRVYPKDPFITPATASTPATAPIVASNKVPPNPAPAAPIVGGVLPLPATAGANKQGRLGAFTSAIGGAVTSTWGGVSKGAKVVTGAVTGAASGAGRYVHNSLNLHTYGSGTYTDEAGDKQ